MYVSVRPSVGCRWAWAWTLHIGTTMRHIRAAWHGSRLEAQLYNIVDSPFDHWIDQKFSLQVFELHFFLSPSSLGWWTTFFSIGLQHHSCVCAFIDLPLFTNVHGIDTCVDVFKVMSSCGTNLCGRANERRERGKKRNGLIHTGAVWTYFVRWRWIGIRDTHIRYVDDVRCEMRDAMTWDLLWICAQFGIRGWCKNSYDCANSILNSDKSDVMIRLLRWATAHTHYLSLNEWLSVLSYSEA